MIMLLINELEWQRLKRQHAQEIEKLKKEIEERDQEIERMTSAFEDRDRRISELQKLHDELVNDILDPAPECWDGDQSGESLCVDYVRSLDSRTTNTIGHRDDCSCWS